MTDRPIGPPFIGRRDLGEAHFSTPTFEVAPDRPLLVDTATDLERIKRLARHRSARRQKGDAGAAAQ